MVHFGNLTSMCGPYTSAIFVYSPHRGQEHQIARLPSAGTCVTALLAASHSSNRANTSGARPCNGLHYLYGYAIIVRKVSRVTQLTGASRSFYPHDATALLP
ncbi:hypothetical protein JCGZ_01156 [Jatropha curcas]|uniref:Uncharacterized protein n=1 Tax=Jatropha curcas TaxID=180498 RepID=A0A067LFT6_JATCU|nr:hypothetical protein JCGZ_01156 [Jatropha curcas]